METRLIYRQQEDIVPDHQLLDAVEQGRYERLIDPEKKLEFLLGRTFLKQTLGTELGIPATDVQLAVSDQGKPSLDMPLHSKQIEFSLAHAGGHFLIGLHPEFSVGVDLEPVRSFIPADLWLFFSADERLDLYQLSNEEQQAALLTLFTQKEAFLKAIDKAYGLNEISFRLQSGNWILSRPNMQTVFHTEKKGDVVLASCVIPAS